MVANERLRHRSLLVAHGSYLRGVHPMTDDNHSKPSWLKRRYKQAGLIGGEVRCYWCGASEDTKAKDGIVAFLRIHPHKCDPAHSGATP